MAETASQAGVGTAHLSSELDDDGPYTIHGVALGAGDVTLGSSGVKKKWPGEELKKAADSLEGQPLVKDHQNDSDGTVGEVTKTSYRDGVGVLYEAEIAPHYEELAKDVNAGILEVSARAYHDPVDELEKDDDTEALEVTGIKFDNLSIVSQGASPSNTVNMGEAATMAQGPNGEAVAVMEQGAPRMDAEELADEFDSDSEELHISYEIGDLIEYGDDKLGSVTGIFVEDGIRKYRVRVMERTDAGVAPTDKTETVIAHNAMKGPHVPTSDMSTGTFDESAQGYVGTEEELASFGLHSPEYSGTTTEASGNGRVTMSDFDTDDLGEISEHFLLSETGYPPDSFGDLKLPVVTADGDLSLPKLRAAKRAVGAVNGLDSDLAVDVMMMINRLIMSEFPDEPLAVGLSEGAISDMSAEELQGTAIHTPEFSDTTTGSWNAPALENFTDNSWDDLSQDMRSEISDHYIVSKSGDFPPENFGDLALPVVEPNGNLNLSALQNAKARAGQVEGVGSSDEEQINNIINSLANENFENANFSEDEESEDMESGSDADRSVEEASTSDEGDDRSVYGATTTDDDPATSILDTASTGVVASPETTDNNTMTDVNYMAVTEDSIEELSDPVVMEKDDVEDLEAKADRAEELDDRLEDVNSTLDELAENQEALEDVDEDRLEELREYDDARVLTGEEYEELQGLVDEIGQIFADELAEYSPFEAEELQERFTPLELKGKVEDHDEASVTEELGESETDPDPKGGSASSDELEQSDDDAQIEQKEEELREALASQIEADGLTRQAEKVREGEIGLDEMGIDPEEALE